MSSPSTQFQTSKEKYSKSPRDIQLTELTSHDTMFSPQTMESMDNQMDEMFSSQNFLNATLKKMKNQQKLRKKTSEIARTSMGVHQPISSLDKATKQAIIDKILSQSQTQDSNLGGDSRSKTSLTVKGRRVTRNENLTQKTDRSTTSKNLSKVFNQTANSTSKQAFLKIKSSSPEVFSRSNFKSGDFNGDHMNANKLNRSRDLNFEGPFASREEATNATKMILNSRSEKYLNLKNNLITKGRRSSKVLDTSIGNNTRKSSRTSRDGRSTVEQKFMVRNIALGPHNVKRKDLYQDQIDAVLDESIEQIALLSAMKLRLQNGIFDRSKEYQAMAREVHQQNLYQIRLNQQIQNEGHTQNHYAMQIKTLEKNNMEMEDKLKTCFEEMKEQLQLIATVKIELNAKIKKDTDLTSKTLREMGTRRTESIDRVKQAEAQDYDLKVSIQKLGNVMNRGKEVEQKRMTRLRSKEDMLRAMTKNDGKGLEIATPKCYLAAKVAKIYVDVTKKNLVSKSVNISLMSPKLKQSN